MKMSTDFAVFILSHGRADHVLTYDTLRKQGYTGDIYIVIDNEDDQVEKYKKNFDKVVIFDKLEISKQFDAGDNSKDRRTIVYARNASFNIAKKLGIKYFMQLDDDYTEFRFTANREWDFLTAKTKIKKLDTAFDTLLEFYKSIDAKSIAIAQGGDFVGGENSNVFKKRLARKAMNSFLCSTERPFTFIGRINEDVNTYCRLGSTGDVFFTVAQLRLEQKRTQDNRGGMTDVYLDSGTYIKSFYTVMYQPSSVKIAIMGNKYKRLHHLVLWRYTVPMILDEKYKL